MKRILDAVRILLWLSAGASGAQNSRRSNDKFPKIECHTCFLDLTAERFNGTHDCFLPQRSKDRMTTCRAKYCMAELTTIMGVLAGFDRRCADRCREMCVERGVGIRKEVCTVCCQKESSRPSASVYWYEKSKKKKKKNHPVFEYYTCGTEKLFGSSGLVVPRPLLLFLSILPLGI